MSALRLWPRRAVTYPTNSDRQHCALCELPAEDDAAIDVLVDVSWPRGSQNTIEEHRHICRDCAQRVAEAWEEVA